MLQVGKRRFRCGCGSPVTVHTGLLRLETEGEGQIVDLTEGVLAVVRQSGVSQGLVSVFVTGSTAAVTTMEYEPGGVQDLQRDARAPRPAARPEAATMPTTSSTPTTTPIRTCALRSWGRPRPSRSWAGASSSAPGSSSS